ncbi:PREDICTED: bone marrow proteoglycan [Nanorana parkeri]|uniref:bone marrow proteoglycan n=1 Tax=Nanorana parkeri TaxID=125878 RepID=UPI000854FE11|nr:PREDICTED: bone marrow proteoglycan [Nanorana parkeri]
MYRLLLLLLVGTISAHAQEPEDCPQDDSNEITDLDGVENNCDMPGALETTPLDDSQLEQCDNVTVQVKKGSDHSCPDKSNCYYQAFNCPTTFAWAQHSCRCRSGKLSSVHNLGVNNQIRCVAQRACSNRHYAWIGVWKPGNSCAYVNADGSRVNYSNFASGQRRTYGTWCVAMNLSSGLWYTFNCDTSLPFICTI